MGMVKNSEMPELGAYATAVAKAIQNATEDAGVSGAAIARHMGRAQSYVSTRIQGRRAWTTDEIDTIAELIGIDVDTLWASARKYR